MKVYKFGASWCMPCKTYEPVFNKVTKEFNGLEVHHVDCDDDSDGLVDKFQIKNLPTTIIIQDDGTVNKFSGIFTESELRSKISELIK